MREAFVFIEQGEPWKEARTIVCSGTAIAAMLREQHSLTGLMTKDEDLPWTGIGTIFTTCNR
jgi:hypothetical protein